MNKQDPQDTPAGQRIPEAKTLKGWQKLDLV